jgi:uncharacterized membrane protein YccF (DUF307 family)
MLRLALNLIWLIFGGLFMAIAYALVAVVLCVLIITIPFGVQVFKIAGFALWPFGHTLAHRPEAGDVSLLGNVIWLVLAGWWLALGHLTSAAFLAATIIGLPLAAGQLKMIPVSLWPFGREIVPVHRAPADAVTIAPRRS